MNGGRTILDVTLPATSTGTGTKLTTVLDPMDLSRCREIELELIVTAAATGATDLLDVELQDTRDGQLTWNTRAHAQVLGNQSASATAPYVYRMNLTSAIPLQSPEKGYVETGSAGGTDIPPGVVVNGPFPPPWRKGVTTGTRLSSWRLIFKQTDISGTASFTAEVILTGHEWGYA
jgi:hypothetical protein